MGITAEVYDGASPATLIATLTASFNRGWLDQLNDVGSGMASIHATDADLAAHPTLKNYDNIVRLILDGTPRFAFIIEQRTLPPAPPGEEHDRIWTFSGRGVLALLENAVVYTEAPFAGSLARQRRFDFTAIAYDDSTWVAATQIAQQSSTSPYYTGLPPGWPDGTAFWIWSRAMDGSGNAPTGTSYFRKAFTIATDMLVAVYGTCDNAVRVWIDGELLIEDWPGDNTQGWTQLRRADIHLDAGTHEVVVEGHNFPFHAGGDSPAAILVTIKEIVNGVVTATVVEHTDASWKALDYPATIPAMTVGKILRLLIQQAQGRGCLPGVTLGFSDTVDSNGASWVDTPDIAFDIGSHYLDVVRILVEQFVDVKMSPTLVLNVYNKTTLGTDRTGSVSLLVGTDFEELANSGDGHVTNAVLARIATGELSEHTDAPSLAARIRKEAYIELGSAPSVVRANKVNKELFVDFAAPAVQVQGKVIAAAGPYTVWKPGDTIKMPNLLGVATATTVLSLGISEDPETGRAIFAITGAQDDA